MQFYITLMQYPNISPEIFRLGPIAPRWYGLMYVISFILSALIINYWIKRDKLDIKREDFYDLLLYGLLGVIIGGRLFYVLFYNLPYFLENPLQIINVTAGGMSFHGGLLGVILGLVYFVRRKKIQLYKISDILVICGALGIGFGRIGNFINAELYGRITSLPWCIYFPSDPQNCRHPSQLYESFFEGFLMFAILWFIKTKNPRPGVISWLYIALYGVARFLIEFARAPDPQIGFEIMGLTRGQLFCIPMIIIGIIFFAKSVGKPQIQK